LPFFVDIRIFILLKHIHQKGHSTVDWAG